MNIDEKRSKKLAELFIGKPSSLELLLYLEDHKTSFQVESKSEIIDELIELKIITSDNNIIELTTEGELLIKKLRDKNENY
jgi:predicted methyltransferase